MKKKVSEENFQKFCKRMELLVSYLETALPKMKNNVCEVRNNYEICLKGYECVRMGNVQIMRSWTLDKSLNERNI